MTSEEYIRTRLIPQKDWHDRKSVLCKKRHFMLQGTVLLVSLLVPILAYWETPSAIRFLIIIFGGLSLTLNGFIAFAKYGEHWMRYRIISERLESERYRFEARSDCYSGLDESGLRETLVSRVEEILNGEISAWASACQPNHTGS